MNPTRIVVLGAIASAIVFSGTAAAHTAECDSESNTVQPQASFGAWYLYDNDVWIESNTAAGLQTANTSHDNGGSSHVCQFSDTNVSDALTILE